VVCNAPGSIEAMALGSEKRRIWDKDPKPNTGGVYSHTYIFFWYGGFGVSLALMVFVVCCFC